MKAIIFIIFANTWQVHKCDFYYPLFCQVQSMMSHAKGLAEESLFHPLLKCLLCRVVSMTTGQSKAMLCHIVAGFIMPDLWKVARLQGNYDTPEVVYMCLFIKFNKPFLNAMSFWWKLRVTIFNIKEQLQSFHFNIHIRISCTGCLLVETWKQKVRFSNLAKVKFKLCCVKW